MRSRLRIATGFVLAVVSAMVVSGSAAHGQTGHSAADALRAADAAWLKAYDDKDVDKSVASCDEQGSMLAPNAPIATGRKAIAKVMAAEFALVDYKITWRPDRADVARSGELGYTSGPYEVTFRDASGKVISDRGKYLTVWKKQADGAWKVLFDMYNSDLPPA